MSISPEARAAYDARKRRNAATHFHKKAEWVRQYKLERGCADCGYAAHHAGLEFDHVRGQKLATISYLLRSGSWADTLAEIDKCEVVCGTCHNVRTWTRQQKDAP